MSVFGINKSFDDPDVVVRVHEGKLCAAFATVSIDEVAFFAPSRLDVPGQLEAIAHIADRIQVAVAQARAKWEEKDQGKLEGVA